MRREIVSVLLGCSIAGLGGALLSSACSSGSSTLTAQQACADVAAARCQKMEQCNPQGLINTYGPGLLCSDVTNLCVAPVASGGSCADNSVCAPGTGCIGNSPTAAGTCLALATTQGAACDPNDGGPRCDGRLGLYCNVPEGRICDRIVNAAPTQECGTVDGGVIDCIAGGFCQRLDGGRSGTCIAPVGNGLDCDTTDGPTCAVPARCVLSIVGGTSGICQTTNPAVCN